MRWKLWLGLAASLAACRETVVLDEGPVDGGPTNCGPPVEFTLQSPKVMVALDRSDGMLTRFGDSTVLAVARDALDQSAMRYQNAIWFGYVEFPGSPSFGCTPDACCVGEFSQPSSMVDVFLSKLDACAGTQSCGVATGYQRSTAAALSSCQFFVFNQSDTVRRYILLITNGWPDCGFGGPGSCGDGGETQSVISQLYGNGTGNKVVRTHLVAPGQSSSDQCFHELAVAGGTQDNQSPQDQFDLTNDIDYILHSIATDACDLHQDVEIREPSRVQVTWKGTPIQSSGWDVGGSGYSIVLHDQWCERLIQSGKDDFALYTNCPTPPRP